MKTLCIDCQHAKPVNKSRKYKDAIKYIKLTIRCFYCSQGHFLRINRNIPVNSKSYIINRYTKHNPAGIVHCSAFESMSETQKEQDSFAESIMPSRRRRNAVE